MILIAGWIIGMGTFVLYRYATFQTNAFDLGIFNQAFASTLSGRWFYETPDLRVIPTGSFLAVHFNLLMFGLLPLYALAPGPQTLVLLQTVFLGAGAVPVWLISLHALGDKRLSLLMSACFLFNPAILSLEIYDFHLEAFLPFFLGMLMYAFVTARWRTYVVFLVASLVTIEFASVLVFVMAVFLVLRAVRYRAQEGWRIPFTHFTIRLRRTEALFLLLTFVAAPITFYCLLAGSLYASGVSAAPTDLVKGFLQGSAAPVTSSAYWAQFWLILFGSLLFLPLLAPRSLVMVLPWFAVSLLSVPLTFVIIGYQYGGAFVAPFLVWGAIFGVRALRDRVPWRRLPVVMLVAALLVSLVLCPLNPMTYGQLPGIAYNAGYPLPTGHTGILDRAIALIPANASVLTQNNLFPQVSGRLDAYVYLPPSVTSVDYVLADMSTWYYVQPIWGNQSMNHWLPYFLSSGAYGVLVMDDGVVLIQRGYEGPILMQATTSYRYDYQNFTLFYGRVVDDSSSSTGTVIYRDAGTTNGTFFYGPYTRMPPGTYNVTFRMKAGTGVTGGMLLDAFYPINASGGLELGHRYVNASDFASTGVWTLFSFTFSLPARAYFTSAVELRGMYASGGPFSIDDVTLLYVGAPFPVPG